MNVGARGDVRLDVRWTKRAAGLRDQGLGDVLHVRPPPDGEPQRPDAPRPSTIRYTLVADGRRQVHARAGLRGRRSSEAVAGEQPPVGFWT